MTATVEEQSPTEAGGTGRVVRVIGPVVDVEFGRNSIPELFNALTALAAGGVAIVLVSSELEEVADHSDRILVMSHGRVVGELAGRTSTEQDVLRVILAVEKEENE